MDERDLLSQEALYLLNRWLAGDNTVEYELWITRGLFEYLKKRLTKLVYSEYYYRNLILKGVYHPEDYVFILGIQIADIIHEIFIYFKSHPGKYSFSSWDQFFAYVSKQMRGISKKLVKLDYKMYDKEDERKDLLDILLLENKMQDPSELFEKELDQVENNDVLREKILEKLEKFYDHFKENTLKNRPALRKQLFLLENLVKIYVTKKELIKLIVLICLLLGWRYFIICVKATKEAKNIPNYNRNTYQSNNKRLRKCLNEELEKHIDVRNLIIRALEVIRK